MRGPRTTWYGNPPPCTLQRHQQDWRLQGEVLEKLAGCWHGAGDGLFGEDVCASVGAKGVVACYQWCAAATEGVVCTRPDDSPQCRLWVRKKYEQGQGEVVTGQRWLQRGAMQHASSCTAVGLGTGKESTLWGSEGEAESRVAPVNAEIVEQVREYVVLRMA